MPGAEPFHHDGGPVGVVLCHGFTGTPQSLRPWAEFLASHGLTVSLPRLPGHGTRWQDANLTRWVDWFGAVEREFLALTDRCDQVFVMGLSMGGALAVRLAEQHGRDVHGLVLVNPFLARDDARLRALPALSRVVPSVKGVISDIKKPGATELGYDRLPLKGLHSVTKLWQLVRTDLPNVTQPVLVFRAAEDHVVGPESVRLLLSRISSRDVEEVLLQDSYHVATLDNDAQRIFEGSLEFVRKHTRATADEG